MCKVNMNSHIGVIPLILLNLIKPLLGVDGYNKELPFAYFVLYILYIVTLTNSQDPQVSYH